MTVALMESTPAVALGCPLEHCLLLVMTNENRNNTGVLINNYGPLPPAAS